MAIAINHAPARTVVAGDVLVSSLNVNTNICFLATVTDVMEYDGQLTITDSDGYGHLFDLDEDVSILTFV